MFVVTKGYLLSREDYQDFDEIITFINEYGIKFKCYCLGTRKITSKNARNLDFGNFIEFEFYYSQNKMSKLKKATVITYLDQDKKFSYCLNIINEYYKQIDIENKKYFNLYQKIIFYIISDLNEFLIMVYLLMRFININGIKINFNNCAICNKSNNITNLEMQASGVICRFCAQQNKIGLFLSEPYWNLLKQIQDQELDISLCDINQYNIETLRKICLQLFKFIYENLGLYNEFMKAI